ncbi:hypothetical protein SAMN05660776_0912 [Salegentibacter holothuriorum]|uniref:DUF6933 domain-containing protein n=1 Tax=Salegentibacter holothuriorum TaxID=241145 RepID=A0A1T5AWG1_9FLAO|nr:hypothetical protein [Salegentibacter holothuriorum]SKB39149.1 hypothetical protein SAMN05660776_0912 [Salegentibacter holothuriorum]
MITPLYTSKKLEKHISGLMTNASIEEIDTGKLGAWNVNLFYVERKKCWLATNAKTKYSVILTDIKAKDLIEINEIFESSLQIQIRFDGIAITSEKIRNLIGKIQFYPTNNDKKIIGFQNSHFYTLEYRKAEYGSLKYMPINTIVHQFNTHPFYIGKRSIPNLTNPIEQLKLIIKNC